MIMRHLAPLLACTGLLAGCAGAIDEITQRSTRSSTQVVVDEMTDRATQEKIARGLDEAALEELSRRVAANAVDGAVIALEDPERRERVARVFRGTAMPTGIAEIDDREVAEAVRTAIAASTEGVDRVEVRGLVHDIVDEAVRTAFAAGREEAQGLDVQSGAGTIAREIGKQAAFGFQDAVDETARRQEAGLIADGEGAVLLAAGQAAERYNAWIMVTMAGLGGLVVAVVGLLVIFTRRTKMQRAELEQRDEALMVLTEAVQETDGRPWSPQLREALAASVRDRARIEEVRRLLKEHRAGRAADAAGSEPLAASRPAVEPSDGPTSRRKDREPPSGGVLRPRTT